MKWEMVKLGDVCEINPRPPKNISPEMPVSFVPMQSISDTKKKITAEQIRPYHEVAKGYTHFAMDDVLLAKITPCFENGKVAIAKISNHYGAGSSEFHVFRPKKPEKIFNPFIYYFFQMNRFMGNAAQNMTGSAGQKRVPKSFLESYEIPLPPLPEQQRIATLLDKAQQLIDQRKEQLTLMDKLVQSLFYEMFGDPVTNEKGWELKSVSSVCSSITGGGTPSKSNPEYYTGLIPWVTPKDMKVIWINDSIDKITEIAISSSSAKMIKPGSVLMVVRSGILKNKLPVAINTVPVALNQDMKAFLTKKDLLKAEFLLYTFTFFQPVLLGKVRAVTADNIEFSQIKDLLIPIPPLPLQQLFAERVQQIEAQKQAMTASLQKLEQNFQALMQEAFGQ